VFRRAVILGCLFAAAVAVRLRPDTTYGGAHVTVSAQPQVLRWAGDPEGGAPYVEADPAHPDQLVGFDVEIVALLASAVGRTP
jgi:ABC-type amino acid transport substrate-binding protein